MTPEQQTKVIEAIEAKNRGKLSLLDMSALTDELPDLDFDEVLERLIEVSKSAKFISASDLINSQTEQQKKKTEAESAWIEVQGKAREMGMREVIAKVFDIEWSHPKTAITVDSIRQPLIELPSDKARWRFRDTFDAIDPATHTPPARRIAAPEQVRDDGQYNPHIAKKHLAEARRRLAQAETGTIQFRDPDRVRT